MDELLDEIILYIGDDYSDKQEEFVLSLIDDAIDEILSIMFPYELPDDKLVTAREMALNRYKGKIKRIVQYHYDKQGKEGTILWSENNTSAHYENSGTPSSYLRGIIPVSKIL